MKYILALLFINCLFSCGNYKPLYKIDPKEKTYIIYNKQLKQFDTINHGELENYIMLDNL